MSTQTDEGPVNYYAGRKILMCAEVLRSVEATQIHLPGALIAHRGTWPGDPGPLPGRNEHTYSPPTPTEQYSVTGTCPVHGHVTTQVRGYAATQEPVLCPMRR